MATLQKFKLLATQCAVAAGSPTRSPSTSPVIHLRRRKTLRMLLGRTNSNRRWPASEKEPDRSKRDKEKEIVVRHKLKDLFVSSPPPIEEKMSERVPLTGGGSVGVRSLRPLSASLRQRLLRRAWRPVLVTIPE